MITGPQELGLRDAGACSRGRNSSGEMVIRNCVIATRAETRCGFTTSHSGQMRAGIAPHLVRHCFARTHRDRELLAIQVVRHSGTIPCVSRTTSKASWTELGDMTPGVQIQVVHDHSRFHQGFGCIRLLEQFDAGQHPG